MTRGRQLPIVFEQGPRCADRPAIAKRLGITHRLGAIPFDIRGVAWPSCLRCHSVADGGSLRSILKNGAGEGRFDASHKHHPVTEFIYINRLANRSYRSTVKTLPATLPEPWAVIRGQSSDVQASRLPPRGRRTGVTWDGCEIWIELGRGGRLDWVCFSASGILFQAITIGHLT